MADNTYASMETYSGNYQPHHLGSNPINTTQSLAELAAEAVCQSLATTEIGLPGVDGDALRLDQTVSEKLVRTLARTNNLNQCTLGLLSDASRFVIRSLNAGSCTDITDDALSELSRHQLRVLLLENCRSVTGSFLWSLDASRVKELDLAGCSRMQTSNLLALNSFKSLVSLNLDSLPLNVQTLASLSDLKTLRSLSLANVLGVNNTALEVVSKSAYAHELQSLDISRTNISRNCAGLLSRMPNLTQLSLSGLSRLAGEDFFNTLAITHPKLENLSLCGTGVDQFSLQFLLSYCPKLRFLGLCGVPVSMFTEVILRNDIVVSGQFRMVNVISMLRHHRHDAELTHRALRCLYKLYRGNIQNTTTADESRAALSTLCEVLQIHRLNSNVILTASVSIYQVTRPTITDQDPGLRQKLLGLLVRALGDHQACYQIQKNICLILCHFDLSELKPFIAQIPTLLLAGAIRHSDKERGGVLQRVAVGLTGNWVCLGVDYKTLLGDAGVVAYLVQLIGVGLDQDMQMATVIESVWGALWNITDEAPGNSALFLECGGLAMIVKTFEKFETESISENLLRNMLGLVGNVAEVPSLRHWLLSDVILKFLTNLLQRSRTHMDIEVGYNAAGILAHLCSETAPVWQQYNVQISRTSVLSTLNESVRSWDLRTERTIKYRSLVPIVDLALAGCPEAQAWAMWALVNLCSVYPSRYVPLLTSTSGCTHLKDIAGSSNAYTGVDYMSHSATAYVSFLSFTLNRLLCHYQRSGVPRSASSCSTERPNMLHCIS